jgi:hypothetical protein
MLTPLIACIGFAAVAQSTSGPKAMPEMMHEAERDDRLTTEPRRSGERPQGVLQYDLDSAYLPDVVGGYVEIVFGSDSSTIAAESEEVLREVATLIKERGKLDLWVTAQLQSSSRRERQQAAVAVEAVLRRLDELGIEQVPFRIWRPEEQRPPAPIDVLEIRVLTSAQRPIS